MGQGVRTGLGHGGITCVLQTQFSSFFFFLGGGGVFLFKLKIVNRRFRFPLESYKGIKLGFYKELANI